MFNDTKYTTWYWSIVNRAANRNLPDTVYSERHHIIPKSLGGNDNSSNIATLTAREHFICHYLLTKMVVSIRDLHKMVRAFCMMMSDSTGRRYTSRRHSELKTAAFGILSGPRWSREERQIMSENKRGSKNPNYGKPETSNRLRKYSEAARGIPRTPEIKQQIAQAKMLKLCNTILATYGVISKENLVHAKQRGLIANTYTTNPDKIKQILGFIPCKKNNHMTHEHQNQRAGQYESLPDQTPY